jgi:hypothetical protein
MNKFTVDINIGDTILVGKFKNVPVVVRDIQLDENGQPVIITNTGKKHLFNCRIDKLSPGGMTPAQVLAKAKHSTKAKA